MDLGHDLFSVSGILNQAVCDLQRKLESGEVVSEATVTKILELTRKALTVIRDDAYSSLWIVLLDWLARCDHSPQVSDIYRRIDDFQPLFYDDEETVPGDVVSHLWLTHLPSLELAVLNLVQHITVNSSSCTVDRTLRRSHLLRVSSQEPLIYKTVCRMLASYLKQTTYSLVVVDMVATFCGTVQESPCSAMRHEKLALQDELPYCSDLQTLFSSFSPGSSRKSDADVIARMFSSWKLCREKSLIGPRQESKAPFGEKRDFLESSATVEDIEEEDSTFVCSQKKWSKSCDELDSAPVEILLDQVWMLTVEFRSWVVAAMIAVLVCESKDITACLWLMMTHAKIDFLSEDADEIRDSCLSLVHQLRGLVAVAEVDDRVIGLLLSQLSGTHKNLQARFQSKQLDGESILSRYNWVFDELLMIFLMQSQCVFSTKAWKDILNSVTKSTEAYIHLRCLVNFVHFTKMTFDDWELRKKAKFRARLEKLVENLHETEENCFDKKTLSEELSKILELLN